MRLRNKKPTPHYLVHQRQIKHEGCESTAAADRNKIKNHEDSQFLRRQSAQEDCEPRTSHTQHAAAAGTALHYTPQP